MAEASRSSDESPSRRGDGGSEDSNAYLAELEGLDDAVKRALSMDDTEVEYEKEVENSGSVGSIDEALKQLLEKERLLASSSAEWEGNRVGEGARKTIKVVEEWNISLNRAVTDQDLAELGWALAGDERCKPVWEAMGEYDAFRHEAVAKAKEIENILNDMGRSMGEEVSGVEVGESPSLAEVENMVAKVERAFEGKPEQLEAAGSDMKLIAGTVRPRPFAHLASVSLSSDAGFDTTAAGTFTFLCCLHASSFAPALCCINIEGVKCVTMYEMAKEEAEKEKVKGVLLDTPTWSKHLRGEITRLDGGVAGAADSSEEEEEKRGRKEREELEGVLKQLKEMDEVSHERVASMLDRWDGSNSVIEAEVGTMVEMGELLLDSHLLVFGTDMPEESTTADEQGWRQSVTDTLKSEDPTFDSNLCFKTADMKAETHLRALLHFARLLVDPRYNKAELVIRVPSDDDLRGACGRRLMSAVCLAKCGQVVLETLVGMLYPFCVFGRSNEGGQNEEMTLSEAEGRLHLPQPIQSEDMDVVEKCVDESDMETLRRARHVLEHASDVAKLITSKSLYLVAVISAGGDKSLLQSASLDLKIRAFG
mmetsp:Transcript_7702/g.19988  ORF Transcript_7702/g.19988 Transcript_7702/m.19988 type:complete len:594 (-) Transcript_7702:171-1952(-)|eukprot:CAMPEP_0113880642 /NCGR_PEP_ID=MMETSP0780_2-20120614/7905_1 /TAXON_ID=652834 /ORGANISM="Palpitomonas bilix" /LENGTH=593 /DNA_ID=CAMNT_0000867353 /DNA_START=74 /DNA_END=1855 /DNA_ORIENTATION=- /assembly_acc=CAM_ASM_000599